MIRTNLIVEGWIYWTITPSLSTEGSYEHNEPRKPLRVVPKWEDRAGGRVLLLRPYTGFPDGHISESGSAIGKIVGDGKFVEDVFEDFIVAQRAYNKRATDYVKGLFAKGLDILNNLYAL